MLTGDSSTDSTVLLESRSDVDDRIESMGDMRMGAADGAESVMGRILSRSKKVHQSRQFRVLGRKSAGKTKPNGPQGGLWVC